MAEYNTREQKTFWITFLSGVAAVVFYAFYALTATAETTAANPKVELNISGEANGKIVITLRPDLAPTHVERILQLAQEGAYDDVTFHRVIEGFMAQTGDVEFGKLDANAARAGSGGSSYPDLPAEFSAQPFVAGTVGMARAQNPNSANSQFFIMFAPAPFLNGQYTVIGEVSEGFDVVQAIKRGQGPNGSVIGAADVMKTMRIVK